MTELERFVHEVFTGGGAPHTHAWPIAKRAHHCRTPRAHEAVRTIVEVLRDTVIELIRETLRDFLVALGAVGTFLSHIGPAATLPVLLVAVFGVQLGIRHISK